MDTLQIPKVTVVIVNYNYGRFLETAYKSVKTQTYPNIETIIVDDKSTDDSVDRIDRILAKDADVAALKLPANVGQPTASLRGLDRADGAYVIFLDSDDQLLPQCVEAHMYAQLSSRISVALTSVDVVNSVNGQDVNLSQAGFAEYVESGQGRRLGAIRPIDSSMPGSWFSKRVPVVSPGQLHFVLPPHADPWVWAPSSGNCYRTDAARLLLREGALDGVRWTDTYLARPLSALFGSIIIDAPLMRYVTHTANVFTKGAPLQNFLIFDPEPEKAATRALTRAAVRQLLADAPVYGARYPNSELFFDAIKAVCDAWPGVPPDDDLSDFYGAQLVANRAALLAGFGQDAVDREFKRRRLNGRLVARIARAQESQVGRSQG